MPRWPAWMPCTPALTQIVLEGGDLDGIAEEVARVLDIGVLFTSTDGRERASAMPGPCGAARRPRPGRPDRPAAGRADRPTASRSARGDRRLRVAAGGTDLARLVCLRPDRGDLLRRRARARAGGRGRGAADDPRAGGHRGREQVPGRLPARPVPAPGRRRAVRRGARGGLRLGPAPAGGGGGRRARPAPDADARRLPGRAPGWQERFSAAWRQVTRNLDREIPSVDFSSEVVTLLPLVDGDDEPVAGAEVAVRRPSPPSRATAAAGGGRSPWG